MLKTIEEQRSQQKPRSNWKYRRVWISWRRRDLTDKPTMTWCISSRCWKRRRRKHRVSITWFIKINSRWQWSKPSWNRGRFPNFCLSRCRSKMRIRGSIKTWAWMDWYTSARIQLAWTAKSKRRFCTIRTYPSWSQINRRRVFLVCQSVQQVHRKPSPVVLRCTSGRQWVARTIWTPSKEPTACNQTTSMTNKTNTSSTCSTSSKWTNSETWESSKKRACLNFRCLHSTKPMTCWKRWLWRKNKS